jgi:hypothetical protein
MAYYGSESFNACSQHTDLILAEHAAYVVQVRGSRRATRLTRSSRRAVSPSLRFNSPSDAFAGRRLRQGGVGPANPSRRLTHTYRAIRQPDRLNGTDDGRCADETQ